MMAYSRLALVTADYATQMGLYFPWPLYILCVQAHGFESRDPAGSVTGIVICGHSFRGTALSSVARP